MMTVRVAMMSTFVPKKCGIATYTAHLRDSLVAGGYTDSVPVIVLTESDEEMEFMKQHCATLPDRFFFLRKHVREDYQRVAMEVNQCDDIAVVCLQHEFSFFGGVAGDFILDFVSALEKPLVTTFHTVSEQLSTEHLRVLSLVAQQSQAVITLNRMLMKAIPSILGIAQEKVVYLPVGAPQPMHQNRESIRAKLGWNQRKVLLTFGLLHPDKGIELLLDVLPEIAHHVPDVLYVVLGETHPAVLQYHGDAYRNQLQQTIEERGIGQHVQTINRFVSDPDLIEYLLACDVYVTPYPKLDQAVSATMAYAVGLQRPILSTPYRYAQDLLGGYDDLLIPYDQRELWSEKIRKLLSEPSLLTQWSDRLAPIATTLRFDHVAKLHHQVFEQAALSSATTSPTLNRPVRVGIEKRNYTFHPEGGIFNFCQEHMRYLSQSNEVELFFFEPSTETEAAQYKMELVDFIQKHQLDIFHVPNPFSIMVPEVYAHTELPPVQLTATVYDLIPHLFAGEYLQSEESRRIYDSQLSMLHRFDRLLSISEHSREDFLRSGFPPEKVSTIGTGRDLAYCPANHSHLDDFFGRFPIFKPYVLAFTPAVARKNAHRLTEAFASAAHSAASDVQLVYVGHAPADVQNQLRSIAARFGRQDAVHFVDYVSKEQLQRLYNRALAAAFPSIYEGWGMPVLEAMQCGTPVLTSNVSSLPEVAQEAAILVDPMDVASMTAGLQRLLTDDVLRAYLKQRGPLVAEGYRWETVAKRTVDAFRHLTASRQVHEAYIPQTDTKHKVRLQPNRYYHVKQRRSKRGATFVSFDLNQIPPNARISRAVLRIPVAKRERRVRIHKISRSWSVSRLPRRIPKIQGTPLVVANHSRISRTNRNERVIKWRCTKRARTWQKRPLKNHGIYLPVRTTRPPYLSVTYVIYHA